MQKKELFEKFEASLPHLLPLDGLGLEFKQCGLPNHVDFIIEAIYQDLRFNMVTELVSQISLSDLKYRIDRLSALGLGAGRVLNGKADQTCFGESPRR